MVCAEHVYTRVSRFPEYPAQFCFGMFFAQSARSEPAEELCAAGSGSCLLQMVLTRKRFAVPVCQPTEGRSDPRTLTVTDQTSLCVLDGGGLGTFVFANLFCGELASANAAAPISRRACHDSRSISVIGTPG